MSFSLCCLKSKDRHFMIPSEFKRDDNIICLLLSTTVQIFKIRSYGGPQKGLSHSDHWTLNSLTAHTYRTFSLLHHLFFFSSNIRLLTAVQVSHPSWVKVSMFDWWGENMTTHTTWKIQGTFIVHLFDLIFWTTPTSLSFWQTHLALLCVKSTQTVGGCA